MSYLRFYYRFVDPNLHLIEQGLVNRVWASINDRKLCQTRAKVGASTMFFMPAMALPNQHEPRRFSTRRN